MWIPKRTKHRKSQKGRVSGVRPNKSQLAYGIYGIRVLEHGILRIETLEIARRLLRRKFKKQGKLWIRVTTDRPVTKKPLETRMGKGKGAVDHWVSHVQAGQLLFEFGGMLPKVAAETTRSLQYRFPLRISLVSAE